MNPKWLKLAASMLDEVAERDRDRDCNDWLWPDGWTAEDQREFYQAIALYVGQDVEDFVEGDIFGPPDWLVMSFLAKQLQGLAGGAIDE